MNIIAIIPARGGSKRIESKNLIVVGGKPLIAHSIEHGIQSAFVDRVIVSTEDAEIARVSKEYGADVIDRPIELANDMASSESALVHVLDEIEKRGEQMPDLVVFMQCTSPVRKADDIDNAVKTLIDEDADSLLSAARNFGLIWSKGEQGVRSLTYDHKTRKREQDMDEQYRENGSIYVFKPEILREHNNRLGKKIAIYEMDMWSSFQVDAPEDVVLINWILKNKEI